MKFYDLNNKVFKGTADQNANVKKGFANERSCYQMDEIILLTSKLMEDERKQKHILKRMQMMIINRFFYLIFNFFDDY